MIEPPTIKKPSSGFLSRMRSPRKSSKQSSDGHDDPSSSTSSKQLLKDQYNAYSENKNHEKHVKEVEQQNKVVQQKRSKAEAWLISKGFSKEAALEYAAASVLQVGAALCNTPSRCHIHYPVRISVMVCPPLYDRTHSQLGALGIRDPLQWVCRCLADIRARPQKW